MKKVVQLLPNHYYKICFDVGNGKSITYTCLIISVDDVWIKFKDKFDKILDYKKERIISSEEINP